MLSRSKSSTWIAVSATAGTLFGGMLAYAAGPDEALASWLGKEITITQSALGDHIPAGGKLTLVLDADENVVRVCTRSVTAQRGQWRMDMAPGCNVALNFTRGTRYCSAEDVKAGNAEILSTCHRLRSQDVALHPAAAAKGAVELHDVILFLVQEPGGKHGVSILLDSPSRVTHGGVIHGTD